MPAGCHRRALRSVLAGMMKRRVLSRFPYSTGTIIASRVTEGFAPPATKARMLIAQSRGYGGRVPFLYGGGKPGYDDPLL